MDQHDLPSQKLATLAYHTLVGAIWLFAGWFLFGYLGALVAAALLLVYWVLRGGVTLVAGPTAWGQPVLLLFAVIGFFGLAAAMIWLAHAL